MTARTTKPVTIRTRAVGQSFGCEGMIVAANGRVLATTRNPQPWSPAANA